MEERIDQLEKYYDPVEQCQALAGITFWLSAICSLIIPYSNLVPVAHAQEIISVFFIVVVLAHFFLQLSNSLYLIPKAERLRRKQLLSNSFGVPLIHETTSRYYNNRFEPSITKLGACVFENAFFAKNICNEMVKSERIKVFIYALFWVVAISWRSTDLGVILTLTQIIFSGDLLVRWIKIEILRYRNETIFNDLYNHFLKKESSKDEFETTVILDNFAAYEAAKASAAIKQSSKIFQKLNEPLSYEWKTICKTLKMDIGKVESHAEII